MPMLQDPQATGRMKPGPRQGIPLPTTDSSLTAISPSGWSVSSPNPALSVGKVVSLSRLGFDTNGLPTYANENLLQTTRLRTVWQSSGWSNTALDGTLLALSDYIYSTDTITGTTLLNASLATSPMPICAWARPHRKIVGNTMPAVNLELLAFHRNARNNSQVACVVWTISDGTNTVTAKSSAMVVSGFAGDLNAVQVYRPSADVDVSSLNAGQLTINAKVYPWIGGAAAVADSSLNADGSARAVLTRSADAKGIFSPRIFIKNVAYAANPPLAYVSSGGSDSTGVVSTSAATASANPFATVTGAEAGLKASSVVTGADLGGCRIRLMAGTNTQGSTPSAALTQTSGAALIIEGDPVSTAANCTLSKVTGGFGLSYVIFSNLTIARGANAQWALAWAAQEQTFYQNASVNYPWLSGTSRGEHNGISVTGGAGNLFAQSTSFSSFLNRGITNTDGAALKLEPMAVVGCTVFASTIASTGTVYNVSDSGGIVAFNKVMKCGTAGTGIQLGTQVNNATDKLPLTTYGFAMVGNVVEEINQSAANTGYFSSDSFPDSTSHVCAFNNTWVGFADSGRVNMGYDESSKTGNQTSGLRTHVLWAFKGNTMCSRNYKESWFYGSNGNGTANKDGDASSRTGSWPVGYGVGFDGEFTQYACAGGTVWGGYGDATSSMFAGTYSAASGATPASANGSSKTTGLDPLFVAPAQTTSSAAGAGNGNYALQSGSPLKSLMTTGVLPFDIAGNARRAANDTSGAYALAA